MEYEYQYFWKDDKPNFKQAWQKLIEILNSKFKRNESQKTT